MAPHLVLDVCAESPQVPFHVSPSQLTSAAVLLCSATHEHRHRASDGAVSGTAAGALQTVEAISRMTGCEAPAERHAGTTCMVSAQLELVSGSPGAAKVAQVDLMVQPGFQLPEDDPQGAAEPAAADALLRAALPSVAQEVNDTAAAVVKEECVRESPAWKARAAREAAQHTGNTLFAELICQPGLAPAKCPHQAVQILYSKLGCVHGCVTCMSSQHEEHSLPVHEHHTD